MPRVFKCPRCGRKHSISEYEEDRFCRNCESLLVDAGYAEEEVEGWRRLFPYDPYPPQVSFMDDIERVLGKGEVLIAEACNGFGKTVSSLSALLAMGRRIIYATRTHEQVRQVLQELETINKKNGTSFTAVNLASRQFLCLNPDCQDLPVRDAQEQCSLLRETGECPWVSDIENLPTDQFTEKVETALRDGPNPDGGAFVLMPSACPYGRELAPLTMKNYERIVELVEKL